MPANKQVPLHKLNYHSQFIIKKDLALLVLKLSTKNFLCWLNFSVQSSYVQVADSNADYIIIQHLSRIILL